MGRTASFAASIDLVRRYQRERLPLLPFVPLALFLNTAALAGSVPIDWLSYAFGCVLACALIAQYRLWDDLHSLATDRRRHPHRFLCQVDDARPFIRSVWILGSANVALAGWLAQEWTRPIVLAVLAAAFAVGYRLGPRLRWGELSPAHGVLVKYPVFVWVLSPPHDSLPGLPLWLAMAAVFLCMAIHEIVHDEHVRSSRGAGPLVLVEAVLLVFALAGLAVLHYRQVNDWSLPLWVQVGSAALTAVLVVRLLAESPRPRSAYALFLAGFPAFLAYAVGAEP